MINPSYERNLRAMGNAGAFIQWDILIRLSRSLLMQGLQASSAKYISFFSLFMHSFLGATLLHWVAKCQVLDMPRLPPVSESYDNGAI